MRALFFTCALLVSSFGCNNEKPPSPRFSAGVHCLLGPDALQAANVYFLPTFAEAKQLFLAEKNRQQGTINLLLAKYDAQKALAGTDCEVLETRDEFAKVHVQVAGASGWIPLDQLRHEKEKSITK